MCYNSSSLVFILLHNLCVIFRIVFFLVPHAPVFFLGIVSSYTITPEESFNLKSSIKNPQFVSSLLSHPIGHCHAQLHTPPSVSPDMPFPPQGTGTIPAHRRGAPPQNQNAFKHGLYSAKNKPSIPGIPSTQVSYRQFLESCSEGLSQAIPDLRQKVILVLNLTQKPREFYGSLSMLRLATRLVTDLELIMLALYKLQQPARDLQFVARHAIGLIRLEFRSQGITQDADLFLEKRELSDFNSITSRETQCLSSGISCDPDLFFKIRELSDFNSISSREQAKSRDNYPYPFLAPRQWTVLKPLLPPPDQASSRGRSPVDPCHLIDAIFWKFAHHARWQDLPHGYPSVLTCRRYYRRLFLSGCLATLYSALHKDFRLRELADLTGFVTKGCFEISHHNVTFHPGLAETWQLRTALLFLQQGYQFFRCHYGKKGRNSYEL